jgi:hypothetical protein
MFERLSAISNPGDAPRKDGVFNGCRICGTVFPSASTVSISCVCTNLCVDVDYVRFMVDDFDALQLLRRLPSAEGVGLQMPVLVFEEQPVTCDSHEAPNQPGLFCECLECRTIFPTHFRTEWRSGLSCECDNLDRHIDGEYLLVAHPERIRLLRQLVGAGPLPSVGRWGQDLPSVDRSNSFWKSLRGLCRDLFSSSKP